MIHKNITFVATLCTAIVCLWACEVSAADQPVFQSQQFEKGTLVYSDDFDGEYNRERWGAPKKDRQIKDGKLVVTARFKSKEEAMKVLKRDHHLGLEPVVHLNRINRSSKLIFDPLKCTQFIGNRSDHFLGGKTFVESAVRCQYVIQSGSRYMLAMK